MTTPIISAFGTHIPFEKLMARTDFSSWNRDVLNQFARQAADALHARNEDAERFVQLANMALSRDSAAAEKLIMICPDPRDINELRAALDQLRNHRAD